jgi:hypothetical protein
VFEKLKMRSSYMLLLKVYGRPELAASLRHGNWIGSFRICLKILDEWELKKEKLGSFEERVVSLAAWSCKHGIILTHLACKAGKVKGRVERQREQDRLERD